MCMADRQDRWQAGINASLGATPLGAKTSEHAILIREEGNTDPSHAEKRLGQAQPMTPPQKQNLTHTHTH